MMLATSLSFSRMNGRVFCLRNFALWMGGFLAFVCRSVMNTIHSAAHLLLPGIAKEAYKWFRSPSAWRTEAEFRRLGRAPRRVPMTMRIAGRAISVIDGPSAASMGRTFFGPRQALRFDAGRSNPLIYDCGANIGISVLYWKSLYPHSRVVAFEPDPFAFACLRRNCISLPAVELHQAAVWKFNGDVMFSCNGADGGCLALYEASARSRVTASVKAIRLRDLLTEPIDMLKMDIEGAEVDVLRDCADRLSLVQRLFVEYHSFEASGQRLDELLEVLRWAGLRVYVANSEHEHDQPFVKQQSINGKDMHLDVFAVRQEQ